MIGSLTFTSLIMTWVAGNAGITWQHDYATAYRLAAEQKKPLVVFLGHGQDGLKTLVTDGGVGSEDAKTVSDAFVPLYIDTDAPAGKELAKSFEMQEGVVISDRSGGLQAVRFDGPVSKTELHDMLTTYSDTNRTVATTEYRGRTRTPIRTLISYPAQFRYGQAGTTGGTCRTGNCPNR